MFEHLPAAVPQRRCGENHDIHDDDDDDNDSDDHAVDGMTMMQGCSSARHHHQRNAHQHHHHYHHDHQQQQHYRKQSVLAAGKLRKYQALRFRRMTRVYSTMPILVHMCIMHVCMYIHIYIYIRYVYASVNICILYIYIQMCSCMQVQANCMPFPQWCERIDKNLSQHIYGGNRERVSLNKKQTLHKNENVRPGHDYGPLQKR